LVEKQKGRVGMPTFYFLPFTCGLLVDVMDGVPHEVEGWVEQNPDEVYVVPVDGARFDTPVLLFGI
jgi:hypothetical protein